MDVTTRHDDDCERKHEPIKKAIPTLSCGRKHATMTLALVATMVSIFALTVNLTENRSAKVLEALAARELVTDTRLRVQETGGAVRQVMIEQIMATCLRIEKKLDAHLGEKTAQVQTSSQTD